MVVSFYLPTCGNWIVSPLKLSDVRERHCFVRFRAPLFFMGISKNQTEESNIFSQHACCFYTFDVDFDILDAARHVAQLEIWSFAKGRWPQKALLLDESTGTQWRRLGRCPCPSRLRPSSWRWWPTGPPMNQQHKPLLLDSLAASPPNEREILNKYDVLRRWLNERIAGEVGPRLGKLRRTG